MENDWIEVRKECTFDSDGEYVVQKVVLEKVLTTNKKIEKKDIIDYFIRIIGIISIFMPLFLFFKQQEEERLKQDRLQKLNLYSTAIVDLHSFSKEIPFSKNYEKQSEKILFESYPRIIFLNDQNIVKQFTEVKSAIEFTNILNEIYTSSEKTDSLISYFSTVGNLDIIEYHNSFNDSNLNNTFRFLQEKKKELQLITKSETSKENIFLKKSVLKFDSLINENLHAIYYLQNKNSRDSILADGDFLYFVNPVLSKVLKIHQYKNNYKIFLSNKIRIIDSLMIKSSKGK